MTMALENESTQEIAVFSQVEAALQKLEEQGLEVVDFETDDGYARAKQLRKPLATMRKNGNDARLAATKWHREEQKRINSLWNDDILPRLEKLEKPLTEGIKAVDDERKRIKAEEEAAEQKRIDDIKDRIADIRAAAGNAITLDDVESAIERYGNVTLESFEEFAEEAEQAIADMDTALTKKKKALEEQAAEAARLAAEREEQDRRQAEMEVEQQKLREEREAMQAELQAQKDQIEAERREVERAKQDEAQRAAVAEAQRKAQEKADREKQEQTERAEREKAEAVEAAKREAERQEQIAKEQAEAKKAEAERVAAMAPDADKIEKWLEDAPLCTSKEGHAAKIRIDEFIGEMISELRGQQ